MVKKPWSFKFKLIASILLVSTVPLLVSAIINLNSSTKSLEQAALLKLESVRESKNLSISRYLKNITDNIVTLAHNQMIIDSTPLLKNAFFQDAKLYPLMNSKN